MTVKNIDQQEKRIVAAFDFDGTLTTRDTLTAFIGFTHGRRRLLRGLLRHAHWLLLMKLGLCSNGKVKEKVFSYFYRGTPYGQFAQWGRDFAVAAQPLLCGPAVGELQRHLAEGHAVCVVTASIDEWVRPLCGLLGVGTVLATQIELSPIGTLTGRFLTPNCYGAQKVARLLEAFPQRHAYWLCVYGDSRGDRELLAMADAAYRPPFSFRWQY